MEKGFSIKRLFLVLPFIYIGFGWYIGLNYGQKPVIFGPYADIPVVMKTSLLGSSLEEISDSNALVMVVPPGEVNSIDQDSTYFKITGYFEVPGTWNFEFPASYGEYGTVSKFHKNINFADNLCFFYLEGYLTPLILPVSKDFVPSGRTNPLRGVKPRQTMMEH